MLPVPSSISYMNVIIYVMNLIHTYDIKLLLINIDGFNGFISAQVENFFFIFKCLIMVVFKTPHHFIHLY